MMRFEELAFESTPMGELTLRRRHVAAVDAEVYEVKLGDEYLMSSLFTVAEVELARLGLAASTGPGPLEVVVGGLGLGYTAVAALDDDRVGRLVVVDALPEVISWHERRLLPVSARLVDDDRTRLVHADFFAVMRGEPGAHAAIARQIDVILLDVDHTPDFTLDPSHADLYSAQGLRRLARHLRPEGVFALWSDDPPAESFLQVLRDVFSTVEGHTVEFDNPVTGGRSRNGVYVASMAA
ncbi:MAG: spermidine synthase [Microcella sp.]|uniref:spermidine synthase n=1 Tax=Microcella sp. TaxID=1913979 RepID=UPI0024C88414|nr:spermidine synthase [Microcella sp.]UYN84389.1 MAG: spermidine synthase [Microcella sp.]